MIPERRNVVTVLAAAEAKLSGGMCVMLAAWLNGQEPFASEHLENLHAAVYGSKIPAALVIEAAKALEYISAEADRLREPPAEPNLPNAYQRCATDQVLWVPEGQ